MSIYTKKNFTGAIAIVFFFFFLGFVLFIGLNLFKNESGIKLDKDQVTKIIFSNSKGEKLTIQKKGSDWVLVEKFYFPASSEKIDQFFRSFLSLKPDVIAEKNLIASQTLENLKKTGETKIEFFQEDQKTISTFIGFFPSLKKSYLRIEGENQIFFFSSEANEYVPVAQQWWRKNFLKVNKNDFSRITGFDLELIQKDSQWRPGDIPQDHQLNHQEIEKVVDQLTQISFTDVVSDRPLPEWAFDRRPLIDYNLEKADNTKQTIKVFRIMIHSPRMRRPEDSPEYLFLLKSSLYPYYFKVKSEWINDYFKIDRFQFYKKFSDE